jgi:phage virion morphogenesis protein
VSGVGLNFDLSGLPQLGERIARLGRADRGALLDDLGAEVVSQTQRRIGEEKTGPDGERWPAWSASHARTRHGNQSLLVASGDLLDTITHVVSGERVEIGSNLVYAAAHQFGLDMSVVSSRRRVTIPARPYLGLSGDNEADLEAIADDFVQRALEEL